MKTSSMKFRFLSLIMCIGLTLGSLLAFFSPYQAKQLGGDILRKDASFIARLLAENLALGMQTFVLDNGATLDQTLAVLQKGDDSKSAAISAIKVFDDKGGFVKGLNAEASRDSAAFAGANELVFQDLERNLRVVSPMYDSGKKLVGYVQIDFSKQFLTDRTARNSSFALLLGLIVMAVMLSVGFVVVRRDVNAIQALVNFARKVAAGDVNVSIGIRQNDEIGSLASSLGEMIKAQKARAEVANQIARGQLAVRVEAVSDADVLGKAMAAMRENILALATDVKMLAASAVEGRLDTRANADRHEGDFREIINGVNHTLDAVVDPVREATLVLERVATRDLTVRMTGEYLEDHARIKNAVNTAVDNLDQGLHQVDSAVSEVAVAADQIDTGNQSMAQGASEQAASLEEISSNLREMAATTRENSERVREAELLAQQARHSAAKGVESMKVLSETINKMKASSDSTSKIIKTIDEIAFQTNLLALNAAVEAARAGDAGKGFAVVAEEVRNLAMRCAEAAKNTTAMLEASVKNANEGVLINEGVTRNLEEINLQIARVGDVMAGITAASSQQSEGINQTNAGLSQINEVTQRTVENAEQSVSAAGELTSQARKMSSLVASFKLTSENRTASQLRTRRTLPKNYGQGRLAEKPAQPIPQTYEGIRHQSLEFQGSGTAS